MNDSGNPSLEMDDRLHQLVEEYSHRLAAGECLTPEDFISCHPQYADELAELLPAASVMAAIGSELKRNRLVDAELPHALGDFRIVREIGRGGMGIVYEAVQLSLNRQVALKVLPFAHMLDAHRLQRFKNEAHAAATLYHPNIVNAFFVGHERGVHFYAMRYVDGVSLADLITKRWPSQQHHWNDTSAVDHADPTDSSTAAQPDSAACRTGRLPKRNASDRQTHYPPQ